MGEAVTLGKVEISSTQSAYSVTNEATQKSTVSKKIESFTKTDVVLESQLITSVEIQSEVNITNFKSNLLIEAQLNASLADSDFEKYGPGAQPIKELTMIAHLLNKGSSIDQIKEIYNSNGFVALKQPESQFALVQLIERLGHGEIITEILVAEHVGDDELLASTVGFLAFLKMIELKHTNVETVISLLSCDDFTKQEWKSLESKEVLIA